MPAHTQPAAYAVVVEYEDGTVGTSLVVDPAGAPALRVSREDLRLAAWLVAVELADGDESYVHDLGGSGSTASPDPSEGAFFRVADEPEDDGIDVYVRPMGRVTTR